MTLLPHDWDFSDIPVQLWLAAIELSDSANASSESSMARVKLALVLAALLGNFASVAARN